MISTTVLRKVVRKRVEESYCLMESVISVTSGSICWLVSIQIANFVSAPSKQKRGKACWRMLELRIHKNSCHLSCLYHNRGKDINLYIKNLQRSWRLAPLHNFHFSIPKFICILLCAYIWIGYTGVRIGGIYICYISIVYTKHDSWFGIWYDSCSETQIDGD